GLTGLVEERAYVRVRPCGIHEYEGTLSISKGGAVAARGLALPAVQVEEPLPPHDLEVAAEVRVHPGENRLGSGRQGAHVGEGPAPRPAQRIRYPRQPVDAVPRLQAIQAHQLTAPRHHALTRGNHSLLHRIVKPLAVFGGVVEAVLFSVGVVAVVGEPGIARNGLAQLVLTVEDIRDRVSLVGEGPQVKLERALPYLTIGAGLVDAQRRKRNGPTVPGRIQAGRQLLPSAGKLLQVAKERDVRLPKELLLIAHSAEDHLEVGRRVAGGQQPPTEADPLLLGSRPDVLREAKVCRFLLGVCGVARVGHGRQRARFGKTLLEPPPGAEPAVDVVQWCGGEVLVVRLDLRPGGLGEVPWRLRSGGHRPRLATIELACVRHLWYPWRPRRRRQPDLLRPLCSPAPGSGVGGDRRRRPPRHTHPP